MARADTNQALEKILHNPAVWRADQAAHGTCQGISTAYPRLNEALPEAGWPVGALTELLVNVAGTGELALLTPALRSICADGRGIALLAPPYVPQARAWEAAGIPLERMLVIDGEGNDLLWAAEQVLRSGECGAVLLWGQAAGRALTHRALQRLHLAASTGSAVCFLYRSGAAEANPSPALLRLRLTAHAGVLQVNVVKCRGAVPARPIPLQLFPAHWNTDTTRTSPSHPPETSRELFASSKTFIKPSNEPLQPPQIAFAPSQALSRPPLPSPESMQEPAKLPHESAKEPVKTPYIPLKPSAASQPQQAPCESSRDLSEAVQALYESSRVLSESLQTSCDPLQTRLQKPSQSPPALSRSSQASSASSAGIATQLRLVVPDPAHSA